ncbi:MAG TPA: DUF883 family protein [Steroidobacteraceae bacterium]|nr:DUF883 family protein [Steroidobacteraceae bacterium]
METTFERAAEPSRDNGPDSETLRTGRATRRQSAAATEWRDLIADVEDLLSKVANVSDVEIARVRERLQKTLATVRGSATAGAQRARVYAQDATNATEEYVRESPWTAVGLAAAVGVLIGFIASRR